MTLAIFVVLTLEIETRLAPDVFLFAEAGAIVFHLAYGSTIFPTIAEGSSKGLSSSPKIVVAVKSGNAFLEQVLGSALRSVPEFGSAKPNWLARRSVVLAGVFSPK